MPFPREDATPPVTKTYLVFIVPLFYIRDTNVTLLRFFGNSYADYWYLCNCQQEHIIMEVIQSFTIDHTHLKPGIYVSREDKGFTTFDIRITEPNKEPAVAPAAMHSMEHLMATWFRNSWAKEDVVYVGPMGCLTGMYIIMTGNYTVQDMRKLTIECMEWILTQDEVPATRPEACGNYLLHDLPMCKWECARYLDRLKNDFHSEYTKLQITLSDGKTFADA